MAACSIVGVTSVEVRDYRYRTYTYRYYGYNDTTEVVVELTDIFLELDYIGNLQVKRGGVITVDHPPLYK